MTNFTTGRHVLGNPAMGVIDHNKKQSSDKVDNDGQRQPDDSGDKAKAANTDRSGIQ